MASIMRKLIWVVLALILVFTACSKEEDIDETIDDSLVNSVLINSGGITERSTTTTIDYSGWSEDELSEDLLDDFLDQVNIVKKDIKFVQNAEFETIYDVLFEAKQQVIENADDLDTWRSWAANPGPLVYAWSERNCPDAMQPSMGLWLSALFIYAGMQFEPSSVEELVYTWGDYWNKMTNELEKCQ